MHIYTYTYWKRVYERSQEERRHKQYECSNAMELSHVVCKRCEPREDLIPQTPGGSCLELSWAAVTTTYRASLLWSSPNEQRKEPVGSSRDLQFAWASAEAPQLCILHSGWVQL